MTKTYAAKKHLLKFVCRDFDGEYYVDPTGHHWEWNGEKFVPVPLEVDTWFRYSYNPNQ